MFINWIDWIPKAQMALCKSESLNIQKYKSMTIVPDVNFPSQNPPPSPSNAPYYVYKYKMKKGIRKWEMGNKLKNENCLTFSKVNPSNPLQKWRTNGSSIFLYSFETFMPIFHFENARKWLFIMITKRHISTTLTHTH